MGEQLPRPSGWDDFDAYLCACKNEPYTLDEWKLEAARLEAEWREALAAITFAEEAGVCRPARFGGALLKWRERHGTAPRELSEAEQIRVRAIFEGREGSHAS